MICVRACTASLGKNSPQTSSTNTFARSAQVWQPWWAYFCLKMSSLNLDRNIGFSLDLKVMAIHRSKVEISYIVLYIFPKGKQ